LKEGFIYAKMNPFTKEDKSSRLIYYSNKIRIVSIVKVLPSTKRNKYVYVIEHSDEDKIKLFKLNKIKYL
jgi:hypothetical protein